MELSWQGGLNKGVENQDKGGRAETLQESFPLECVSSFQRNFINTFYYIRVDNTVYYIAQNKTYRN